MGYEQIQAFRTYQRISLGLFNVYNLWFYRTKLSTILCMLIFATSVVLVYFFTNNVVQHTNSVPALLVNLGRLITAIGVVFKLFFVARNSKNILYLHTTLLDTFEEDLAQRTKATLHCSVYKFSIPVYIQLFSFFLACVLSANSQGVYILGQLIHFRIPDTNYTLMISLGHGYPWPLPKGYLYHAHFLFELTQLIIICITAMSIDCFFGFYAYLLCSNVTALSVRLANPRPKEKFLDLLHTCLKKYNMLLECRELLEHIYKLIAFLHIVTNSVQLCCFMYLLLSEELREGVYFSNWQDTTLDLHVKTGVTIALMQEPMTIRALIFPLDLKTFSSVLNTAMSYFCLLQSLEN